MFLAHLNTPVRRKSPRKHFFARHSATGVTGAGAAASPSAAENRSFKLTFYVNFSSLPKNSTFTTLDTAGQPFTTAEPFFSRLTTLLEHTDLVILDLKHIDPEKHRLLAGHSNESILSFARFLDQIHKPMWVRHVLVPGITDDPANLHGIRAFLDTLSNVEKVEILPYHTLGIYKWETLGIPYSLSDIRIPDENDLKRANQILLG